VRLKDLKQIPPKAGFLGLGIAPQKKYGMMKA
jgi:hypothetical protein